MASGDSIRDRQRSLVYEWERIAVSPYQGAPIAFHNVEIMVKYVWEDMGLLYPPRVRQLQPNVVSRGGDATRDEVRFPAQTDGWTVLHELAHSMTMLSRAETVEGHGPEFVGMAMQLYSKYLGIDMLLLEHSATQMGVRFKRGQRPVFLDK